MDNKLLIALVDSLVSDAIQKLELREGPRGPRGLKGRDGNDFRLEDHSDQIVDLILQHIPKTFDLTEDQIALLKGEQGPSGRDGRDGRDGKDFIFEEHVEALTEIIKEASLKFEDFTPEQIESLRGEKGDRGERGIQGRDGLDGKDFDFEEHSEKISKIIQDAVPKFEDFTHEQIEVLRGPKGSDGKDGKDFSFEDSREEINNLLVAYINEIREVLTLKFDDLTEDQKASLRGPRGQRGKPGRDFDLEESLPTISNVIHERISEIKEELKLKFTDLSEEERDSLKLKFEDITPEERLTLRGPRGQRGKIGLQGEQGPAGKDGIDGKMGPRGLPGLSGKDGRNGIDGRDGRDGQDAPKVIDVIVEQSRLSPNEFNLVFEFDNGTQLKTDDIKLPKGDTIFYYPAGMGSGGGNGKSAYDIAVEEGFVGTKTEWLASLQGADGVDGANGLDGKSAYEIAVDNGFTGTETEFLNSLVGADGVDGKSAYEIAVDNGFVGTEQEWLDSLNGSGSGGAVEILDEYGHVTSGATSINFIGDYVKVRPRVNMDEWATLSDVEPSLIDYVGSGNPPKVDVYFEPFDPSLVKDVDCLSEVYVGSFVRMDGTGTAHNALADSYENANVIGLVESKPSPLKCNIRVIGKSSDIFTGLDTSLDYFLSDTVPGGKVTTPPNTTGHIKLKLGQAFSESSFLLAKGERVVRS